MSPATRPVGDLLCTVATVNDLHFGETVCGVLSGVDVGPPIYSDPGATPYPVVMNRAAVDEIVGLSPSAVVLKGDLTATGSSVEYREFKSIYDRVPGDRLVVTLGNHDKPLTEAGVPPVPPVQAVEVDGATLAVLDTARAGHPGGQLSGEQTEWLDELAARSDRPILVFGHHPAGGDDIDRMFGPASAGANSLDRNSTERLVAVVQRRPALIGYFAGHTHRNKVRNLATSGGFPWVEVACVKDFPGSWAEYRIYEDGVFQVHHRISSDPEAIRWSERCRDLFGGWYPAYSLGSDTDRCFEIPLRDGR